MITQSVCKTKLCLVLGPKMAFLAALFSQGREQVKGTKKKVLCCGAVKKVWRQCPSRFCSYSNNNHIHQQQQRHDPKCASHDGATPRCHSWLAAALGSGDHAILIKKSTLSKKSPSRPLGKFWPPILTWFFGPCVRVYSGVVAATKHAYWRLNIRTGGKISQFWPILRVHANEWIIEKKAIIDDNKFCTQVS